jgi:hypothetical protein
MPNFIDICSMMSQTETLADRREVSITQFFGALGAKSSQKFNSIFIC